MSIIRMGASQACGILGNPARHDELKGYVQGVMRHFKSDKRIVAWDVFNEPDNMNRPAYEKSEPANKPDMALRLLKKVFAWACEVNPKQPLTAGVWERGRWKPAKRCAVEQVMLEQSDIISFHDYGKREEIKGASKVYGGFTTGHRCTEYMAQPNGSHFDPNLGYMEGTKCQGDQLGLLNSKTQTGYPWDSWTKKSPPSRQWFMIFSRGQHAFRCKGSAVYQSDGKDEIANIRRRHI